MNTSENFLHLIASFASVNLSYVFESMNNMATNNAKHKFLVHPSKCNRRSIRDVFYIICNAIFASQIVGLLKFHISGK